MIILKKHKLPYLLIPNVVLLSSVLWLYKKAEELYTLAILRNDKSEILNMVEVGDEFDVLNEALARQKDEIRKFETETPQKQYYVLATDGLALYGNVFVQPEFTHKWAIVVHGYCGYGEQMNGVAKKFYEAGYNVLLPDLRGHGKSDGKYIGMGWHDRLDIVNWIGKIVKGDVCSEILLYGLSMGASTILMASGENLPDNVKCIIEDCGYTSVYDQLRYQYKKIVKLPTFPMFQLINHICKKKAGYSFYEASAEKQVQKCKTPILFIHGEQDSFVPTDMVYRLYGQAKCTKDILVVKSAGHGVSANVDEKNYWDKIYAFAAQYVM